MPHLHPLATIAADASYIRSRNAPGHRSDAATFPKAQKLREDPNSGLSAKMKSLHPVISHNRMISGRNFHSIPTKFSSTTERHKMDVLRQAQDQIIKNKELMTLHALRAAAAAASPVPLMSGEIMQ